MKKKEITEKEFAQISTLARNISSTMIVIEHFVTNQTEADELLYHIIPIIKNLKQTTDTLNLFFLNKISD